MALQLYKIGSIEVGSAGSSALTFSNIPQGYTDLRLDFSLRNTADFNTVGLSINGVTTNQSARRIYSTGSTVGVATYAEVQDNPSSSTANTFCSGSLYIPNYKSGSYKPMSFDIVSENNATLAYASLEAWFWRSIAAITSLSLNGLSGGTLPQYTTATLYGIL